MQLAHLHSNKYDYCQVHCHPPIISPPPSPSFFFFNDTPTTEIYTLSLHDALPISASAAVPAVLQTYPSCANSFCSARRRRSEEHTSELQSHSDLVCRLLLEKKKKKKNLIIPNSVIRTNLGGYTSTIDALNFP